MTATIGLGRQTPALLALRRVPGASIALVAALVAACAASPQAALPVASPSQPASSSSAAPIAVLPGEPWIVYSTDVGAGLVTYLMRPDGTDAHPFAVGGHVKGIHPDWSPDGNRLAFIVDSDVWIANIDGSHAEAVTNDGCCDYPSWSPDRTKLAFTGYSGESLGTKPLTSWIVLLDLATKHATTIVQTKRPVLVDVPRWSPDGKSLVVGVHRMDEEGFETGAAIAVVPAKGGALRYLTGFDAFAFYPDWSRTTNTIVFDNETIVDTKAPGPADKTSDLYVIRPDGTDLRQLTHVSQGTRVIQPTWTPDGSSVLAGLADVWLGVRVDPGSGEVARFGDCCVSHPRLRPTP